MALCFNPSDTGNKKSGLMISINTFRQLALSFPERQKNRILRRFPSGLKRNPAT